MSKMIGFRAPVALLDEFRETLKKEGANVKGGQQKALEEAMRLWIASKKKEVVILDTEKEVNALVPVKDITPELVIEKEELSVHPVAERFPQKVFVYLAQVLVEAAKKNGKMVTCQIRTPDGSVKPLECPPDEAVSKIKDAWNLDIAGQVASVKLDNGEVSLGKGFFDKVPASLLLV